MAMAGRAAVVAIVAVIALSAPASAQTYVGQPQGVPQAGASDVGAPSVERAGASSQRAAVTSAAGGAATSGSSHSSHSSHSSGSSHSSHSSGAGGRGGALARTGFPFARADLVSLLGLSVIAVGAVLVRRARRQLPA